jgi:hypothetical protein
LKQVYFVSVFTKELKNLVNKILPDETAVDLEPVTNVIVVVIVVKLVRIDFSDKVFDGLHAEPLRQLGQVGQLSLRLQVVR